MLVVFEAGFGPLHLAEPLHINTAISVDEDIGYGVVFQKRLQGTKAQDLILYFRDNGFAFGGVERNILGIFSYNAFHQNPYL